MSETQAGSSLPTEPGVYSDQRGNTWQVSDEGKLFRIMDRRAFPDPGYEARPFTRLVPIQEVEEQTSRLRKRVSDLESAIIAVGNAYNTAQRLIGAMAPEGQGRKYREPAPVIVNFFGQPAPAPDKEGMDRGND